MGSRLLAGLAIGMAFLSVAVSSALAADPTVGDVLKTYRENREKFRTMHVSFQSIMKSWMPGGSKGSSGQSCWSKS
jgi:hypothetical protein